MLDPLKSHVMEQGRATLIEVLPPLWYGLYSECIVQGFQPEQAMDLVKTYIMASVGSA